MCVSWITSKIVGNRLVSLYSTGNYTYSIDIMRNGEIYETVNLHDSDLEDALQELTKVCNRQLRLSLK